MQDESVEAYLNRFKIVRNKCNSGVLNRCDMAVKVLRHEKLLREVGVKSASTIGSYYRDQFDTDAYVAEIVASKPVVCPALRKTPPNQASSAEQARNGENSWKKYGNKERTESKGPKRGASRSLLTSEIMELGFKKDRVAKAAFCSEDSVVIYKFHLLKEEFSLGVSSFLLQVLSLREFSLGVSRVLHLIEARVERLSMFAKCQVSTALVEHFA
ncbi:hypothetical protein Acr_14g0002650 [Actinidia rufa]|uniref:Uncharacterized protein n=1 Tax=Actinidia rufa TaxID=165716 RepID=A0A7J0FR46_9ERIC|nr:hypothetical protein Acr_14g0002650 [Actinidia rufa]